MTLGSIDLDMLGPLGEYCLIRNLDTFGDTFSSGATDLFTGDDLQADIVALKHASSIFR